MAEVPLPLRRVAMLIRANHLQLQGDSFGLDTLLALLRAGELKACAKFPELAPIEISSDYWHNVTRDQFKSVGVNRNKGRDGVYRIELKELARSAIAALPKKAEGMAAADMAVHMLQNADTWAEAVIYCSSWREFAKARGVEEEPRDKGDTSLRGRPHQRRDHIYLELAAQLLLRLPKVPQTKELVKALWKGLAIIRRNH